MGHVFDLFFDSVDGRPNGRGGACHIDMLPKKRPDLTCIAAAGDTSIAGGERAIVCIHGMESSLDVYLPLMKRLADGPEELSFSFEAQDVTFME